MTIIMIGQKGLPARSGGVEKHVELLAKGLVSRGHRVIVYGRAGYVQGAVAPEGVDHRLTWGIPTKHLDAITHSFTAVLASLKERPEVLHIHGVGNALLAPLVRVILPRTKLVVTFHSMDRRFDKWGWFARAMLRLGEWCTAMFAHEVITVSQELARYCQKTYGRRATYVSHAFSAPSAETRSAQEARVRALGLEPYTYFLHVGRLISLKGADRFLQAYSWAKAQHVDHLQGKQAVIVGGGSVDDPYVDHLTMMADNTRGAHLLGERVGEELRALQTCAFAHVFPSVDEGLSLAVLEAASTGRPLIMHELEANREAIDTHATFVDARSIAALGGAMTRALEMSQEDLALQGDRARAYVATMYEPLRTMDTMDRLYRGLVMEDETLATKLSFGNV
ncbi:glycosyltransferase family 4 protein [Patescibacteria group bacterium]|nr:glycosyltransferase family 4 protein [Patescibacteria group bacterium]